MISHWLVVVNLDWPNSFAGVPGSRQPGSAALVNERRFSHQMIVDLDHTGD